MSIELDDCSTPCVCHVQTNRSGVYQSFIFTPSTSIRGIVNVKQLQTYTLYMFDANCSNVPNVVTYLRRTDVGRPSSPRNVVVELKNGKLHLKWLTPNQPMGPINFYRILVDGKQIESNLASNKSTYEMKTNYVPGSKQTLIISACNVDTQNRTLCSDSKQSEVIFDGKENTVTSSPDFSSSMSINLKYWKLRLIFCLFILFIIK